MKAGILARTDKPQAGVMAGSLAAALQERGVEVVWEKSTAELAGVAPEDAAAFMEFCLAEGIVTATLS